MNNRTERKSWAEEAAAAIERRARLNGAPLAGHPVASYPPELAARITEGFEEEAFDALVRRALKNG